MSTGRARRVNERERHLLDGDRGICGDGCTLGDNGAEERNELYDWNKQEYETFKEYETKTDRKIPVVILEPVG